MPCRRATSDMLGAQVSCSSADERRRRCTDVITSTCSIFPVIVTVILHAPQISKFSQLKTGWESAAGDHTETGRCR
jgi:hypothetical protein